MLIVLGRTRHTRVTVFPASLPSLESFAEKFGSSLVSVLEHSCSHRRLHHAEINFSSSIALAGGREQFEAAVCLKASGLPTSAVRSRRTSAPGLVPQFLGLPYGPGRSGVPAGSRQPGGGLAR